MPCSAIQILGWVILLVVYGLINLVFSYCVLDELLCQHIKSWKSWASISCDKQHKKRTLLYMYFGLILSILIALYCAFMYHYIAIKTAIQDIKKYINTLNLKPKEPVSKEDIRSIIEGEFYTFKDKSSVWEPLEDVDTEHIESIVNSLTDEIHSLIK